MKLNRDNLHEYQKYGVDFIINNPISALMLECGLGKTITTLTAVSDLMYDYFEIFLDRMMLCKSPYNSSAQSWTVGMETGV